MTEGDWFAITQDRLQLLRIGSGRIQPGINIREGHGFFVFRKLVGVILSQ
jgi:hypothetical protein